MKTQKEIIKWLQANLGKRCTAGLTSSDVYALVTSVNLSNLISYEDAPCELFAAYHNIVKQMQEETRWLAFHAIACELDWGHREMIFRRAGLYIPRNAPKCATLSNHFVTRLKKECAQQSQSSKSGNARYADELKKLRAAL